MDFFESMAFANGNAAKAAAIHSAFQKKGKEITVRTGPAPTGVTIPENGVAVYDMDGNYLGWVNVNKIKR